MKYSVFSVKTHVRTYLEKKTINPRKLQKQRLCAHPAMGEESYKLCLTLVLKCEIHTIMQLIPHRITQCTEKYVRILQKCTVHNLLSRCLEGHANLYFLSEALTTGTV